MGNKKAYGLIVFVLLYSCVSDKEEGVIISDATLFSMAQTVSSFSYFKNSTDTLPSAPESPHLSFVRIRFNPTAREAMNRTLDDLYKPEFPEESMIVKEVYDSKSGPLKHYVIMYKAKSAANSASGWVWSEMKPDGNVEYSSTLKGGQCVSCHLAGRNSDLVRTFALH